jgi:hypothetical protein
MGAISVANKIKKNCRQQALQIYLAGTFMTQNEPDVFVPDIIVASRPGVIVFMSGEAHPYPWDKLIYSSEL